jgi:ABC-2 type transport system permease protein
VGMLGAWAIFGYAVAPAVLRRMAARQSGSRVSAQPAAGSYAA